MTNRICIQISTGKLLEFQEGDAALGTLTQNAKNAGYKVSEIEEKYTENNYRTEYSLRESAEQVLSREKKEADVLQKGKDINDNLPTWSGVSMAIDNATTITELKIIIKKMARVVYWLAKNDLD